MTRRFLAVGFCVSLQERQHYRHRRLPRDVVHRSKTSCQLVVMGRYC